jgi:hypothetical protein
MHLEPSILNRTFHAGTVLGWRAFQLIKERRVDLLDMNATVLNGLDAVRYLDQLARRGVRVGVRAGLDVPGHGMDIEGPQATSKPRSPGA